MKKIHYSLILFLTSFSPIVGYGKISEAQVLSDGSLPTVVETQGGQDFWVTGGEVSGDNLFHSFRDFSVPLNGSVTFQNPVGVNRVIARVTGTQASLIDGLLALEGSSDLLLINPNGVTFGPSSSLDVNGSLLVTTAHSVQFSDGAEFGVGEHNTPLLSVGTPVGLQLGHGAGSIINQNSRRDVSDVPELGVGPGETLAIVGNEVIFDSGGFAVPGRLEVASVGDNSYVGITEVPEGWDLTFGQVTEFSDIVLRDAFISANRAIITDETGALHLTGNNILIEDSLFSLFNIQKVDGGLEIVGFSSIVIHDSNIFSGTFGDEAAGSILIEAGELSITRSAITSSAFAGTGDGGNIDVVVEGRFTVEGGGEFAQIAGSSFSQGKGGNIRVSAQELILDNGSQFASNAFGEGSGGTLTIEAEAVAIRGKGVFIDDFGEEFVFESGLLSESRGPGAGGQILIDARDIQVRDGGFISASSTELTAGRAGQLVIRADETLTVDGSSTSIRSSSSSESDAGDLTIVADRLSVQSGGEISVSSDGMGAAGTLVIHANSLVLGDQGKLTAETLSEEGDVEIQAQDILLQGKSSITTNAEEAASGGNVQVATEVLTLLDESEITANAIEGQGGNIRITAQGLFISSDSSIQASSELSQDGIVEINTPDLDPSQGLVDPSTSVTIPPLIEGCQPRNPSNSQFIQTGRGGIRPEPRGTLGDAQVWEDLEAPDHLLPSSQPITEAKPSPSDGRREPYGLTLDPQGNVMILAHQDPQATGCP